MNVYFNLSIISNCTLHIQDTTQEYEEYLPENDSYVKPNQFKYSDTYTINVIKYGSSNGQNTILKTLITPHKKEEDIIYLDEAYYPLHKDGKYIIEHLIIPSESWIDSQLEQGNKILNLYQYKYFTDGKDFFQYINGNKEKCSIEEILKDQKETTTVFKSTQETFSICNLHNCYLQACQNKIEQNLFKHCYKKEDLRDINIDLIWLGINAIKCNIELGYLNKAQLIIENLMKCPNICSNYYKRNNNECGCSS